MYCASCLSEGEGPVCRACGEDPRLVGRFRLVERTGRRAWRAEAPGKGEVHLERLAAAAELTSLAWDRLQDDVAALRVVAHPSLLRIHEVIEARRARERVLWLVREPLEPLGPAELSPPDGERFVASLLDGLLRWGARGDHAVGHGCVVTESFGRRADGAWVLADFGPARLSLRPSVALAADAASLWEMLESGGIVGSMGSDPPSATRAPPRDAWRIREQLLGLRAAAFAGMPDLPAAVREAWTAGPLPTRPIVQTFATAAGTPSAAPAPAPPAPLPPREPSTAARARGPGRSVDRALLGVVISAALLGWWSFAGSLRGASGGVGGALPEAGRALLQDPGVQSCAAAWRTRNPDAPPTEPHLTFAVHDDGSLSPRASLAREHDLFREASGCVEGLEGRSLPEGLTPRSGQRTLYAVELRLGPGAAEPVELRWTLKPV